MASTAPSTPRGGNAARRPNILLITSDQQHFDTLGITNPRIKTPALDRLAREGANFTRAYTINPVCTPTRATLITGLYPSWHGAWTIGCKLPEDVPTVGQEFQDHGYYTALIGKAHFQPLQSDPQGPGGKSLECQPILRDLDYWRSFWGPWYGFQRIELARNHGDESHVGQHYAIWMEEKGLKNWADYFEPVNPKTGYGAGSKRYGPWDLPQEYHYTTWTGERTIANIEAAAKLDQPFFIWSSYHDPHPPYVVPQPWASMYRPEDMQPGRFTPGEFDHMPEHFKLTQQEKPDYSPWKETPWANHGFQSHLRGQSRMKQHMAIYYGMISFMDHWIGRTLEALDRLGIADNTLVVFTTDHGHFLGQHGLVAKGAFQYEDAIKLPFLVRYPGQVPAGATNDSLQALIDLPTTFLEACGIRAPGRMQGVNQLDVWRGRQPSARDHVICEHRHQPTRVHLRTLVTKRHKLTVYRDQPYGELFDLEKDPGELHNRWDDPAYKDIKAELFRQFVNAEIVREPLRVPRIAHA